MREKGHRQRALEFLETAHLFQLGDLPTERPHPDTRRLSSWAQGDLPRAIAALKGIDLRALGALRRRAGEIDGLAGRIAATLSRGKRVFLCGCGATGRLSLSLESLWRQAHGTGDQVVSLMAGGDVALVHSLEGFEDHPTYGARQLLGMGFSDGDLLVGCTEGGETPFVLGAAELAAEVSSNPPFLLYCNPDRVLTRRVARFRRVYENPRIHKICLHVGPMALAGSTRMQASTVLQLAVGSALLHSREPARDVIAGFEERVADTDFSFLAEFVRRESEIYAAGHLVHYRVRDYGITVFTDTAERAPTFSLVPFEHLEKDRLHSLCYVSLADAASPEEAWVRLLNRRPRPLDWPDVDSRATPEYLREFDFSARALERRRRQIPGKTHHVFDVRRSADGILLRLGDRTHRVPAGDLPDLLQHLLLKLMLNAHSTLVMGRLGRYEGNLMTWVSPTNGKLVDRAARHVRHLLEVAGCAGPGYEGVVRQLFAEMDRVAPGDSVVLATYRSLVTRSGAARGLPRPSACG